MTRRATDHRNETSGTLVWLAGPSLVLAGDLISVSQMVVWPLRGNLFIDAVSSPVYSVAMTAYLAGISALLVGVFAMQSRQSREAGRFGVVALLFTAVGLSQMAGNVWFDTFVVPWLARQIPAALEVPRDGTLVVGALLSYVAMSVGWALFGISCLRARVVPVPLSICLIAVAPLAFYFLPPFSIVFGGVVLVLGIWLVRHRGEPQALDPSVADAEADTGAARS